MKHHPSFLKANPGFCKRVLKDYIGGDTSNPELSPAMRNDPVLAQECRTQGYMNIPIGGQLRNVYCGTGQHQDIGSACPVCGEEFCSDHLAQHVGGKKLDTNAIQIGTDTPGSLPSPYTQMPLGQDTRSQMSTWDNAELNRKSYEVSTKARSERTILKKLMLGGFEKMHPKGQHEILDPETVRKIILEVKAYTRNYGGAATVADIATELATRGKDDEFQRQLADYAQSLNDWLPSAMEMMVSQGYLRNCACGGYLPNNGT